MTTLLLLLALLAQDDDAAATAALDQFKTDYKSKEATVRATAVGDLARTQHDKVAVRLGQLLGVDEKEVRIAAARGLGGNTVNRRKAVAMLSVGAAANAREPMVMAAILEAIGKLKEPAGAAEVERHFKSKQIPQAKAAIEAAASIGSRSSVHPLIDTLKWLEQGAQEAPALGGNNNNTPGVGGGGTVDDAARERNTILRPVVLKTLESLTKTKRNSVKDWEEWWRSEGARFMTGR
jgi:HEAT repeat protein